MKTKRVIRYYCDHCGKAYGRIDAITRHEQGCTKNPNRVCGMCTQAQLVQQPLSVLIDALMRCPGNPIDIYEPYDIRPLVEASGGCPACMLSAIRNAPEGAPHVDFRFDKAKDEFWGEVNRTKYEWI